MRRSVFHCRYLSAIVLLCACAQPASAVTIPTVPIGDAGNANEPATGNLYGGVGYAYRMGTTEVTVEQYTAFLNAVAATDTYALYNTLMATDARGGSWQSDSAFALAVSTSGAAETRAESDSAWR